MKNIIKISFIFLFLSLFSTILSGVAISQTKKKVAYTPIAINYAADTAILKADMQKIIGSRHRNYQNINTLNKVADFIKSKFRQVSDSVSEQTYTAENKQYRNIICSINTDKKERVIVGAHYDVCGNQDGADDNASGVVGLIRLVELLKNANLNYRVDFVAFTLEEPPFFGTNLMGSYVHAKYLKDCKIPVKGMICLEMIGYFTDDKKSQDYPFSPLKMFYGSVGDYIMVVHRSGAGNFGKTIGNKMKQANLLPTKLFKGPKWMKGVDFSDHRNYWKHNFEALMITNMAFYRNKNYHQTSDNIQTIDFRRMAAVVHAVNFAVKELQ